MTAFHLRHCELNWSLHLSNFVPHYMLEKHTDERNVYIHAQWRLDMFTWKVSNNLSMSNFNVTHSNHACAR